MAKMNKTQAKFLYYAQLINLIVSDTEAEQDQMSPKFTALKDALEAGSVADFDADEYAKTKASFADGTDHYQGMLQKLEDAKVPARLMGNHKLLTNAFRDFTQGCQNMVDSLHDDPASFDQAAFLKAEADQDAASERLMKYIQKLSSMMG
ncbi:hypothetical protein [Lacticaseibacillus jixiensis]|uniref:hypothetical protein n=1 Tax=Lacticaseibacillus jixiensis TaxID=3231926 RepID=UPI0036F2E167